ncbi:hypothetical protein Vadar_031206 [Vaccinium darrowii]|uniref:Uncharacterized protein n=1 Tax=Vaccinium darrowii TaxID=229202 RepID=A0ACB7YAC1_9ERIC|nr:hypothetical protein Vadar_031206 [Vaccinium darrowii]
MILNDSDSDDDLEFIAIAAMEVERLEAESSRRSKQRRTVIQRGHLAGQQRLFLDYFADQPVFPPNVFRRRFRMRRSLFLRIHSEDERDENLPLDYEQSDQVPIAQPSHENRIELTEFLHRHRRIRDRGTHSQLQSDLVKHLWALYSQS